MPREISKSNSDQSTYAENTASQGIKDVLRKADLQAESEQTSLFEPSMQRQFQRLARLLADNHISCKIDIMGVCHMYEAGQEIINKTKDTQMVTLELGRNATNAAISGEQSQILKRNIFWKSLVSGLREKGAEQEVRGIEVSQTARVAWKRLVLHYGSSIFSPSFFTFELKDTESKDIRLFQEHGLIKEQEALDLQRHNWAIVDNKELFDKLVYAVSWVFDHNEKEELRKAWPIQITEEIYLAAHSKTEKPSEGRYLTTFIKEPNQSLLKAKECISDMLTRMPLQLTSSDNMTVCLNALQAFLLCHAERNDAEEIVHFIYQYAQKHKDEKQIHLLHIGGAAHAEMIRQAIQSNMTDTSDIEVSAIKDPRFDKQFLDIGFGTFFRKHIPFRDLLSGIKAEVGEVHADPERITDMVRKAITENREEFDKLLLIKNMSKDIDKCDTLDQAREANKDTIELDKLNIVALRTRYTQRVPELRDKE